MSKCVGVVGGSGFVGTRLCRLFVEEGIAFRIIDIAPSFEFPAQRVEADIRDYPRLREALRGCDSIVNLAAEHRDDVRPLSLYAEVNVEGSRNICRAAEELGISSILFTSSVACYGFVDREVDETAPLLPFNEYGRTKMLAESAFKEWQASSPGSRTMFIVRPTVIFGEDNRGNVYNLLNQIHKRRFAMIGSGENRKSLAYVGNVVAFLSRALRLPPGIHLYNYVDKPDFTMTNLVRLTRERMRMDPGAYVKLPYWAGALAGQVADLVSAATRRNFPISSIRVKKFCASTVFNSDKAHADFNPPYALGDALNRTIEFEFMQPRDADRHVFHTE